MMFMAACPKAQMDRLAALARQCGARDVEMFSAVGGEAGLAIFNGNSEIDDPSVAPMTQLFGGGRVGSEGGGHLFKVDIWVPAASRAELLDWYASEHLPILLECPTWDGCRFVEKEVRDGHQFYALHQLADPRALESEERRRSRATPWFMRLKRYPWFDEAFTRALYVRDGDLGEDHQSRHHRDPEDRARPRLSRIPPRT
jgi:hypothetical protein